MSIFTKIKALFVTIEHDVEAIISDFTSTVAKLEAAAKAKMDEYGTLTTKAEQHYADAAEALKASDKATAVADKIKALVS
jgi:hypothetical protein